MAQDSQTDSKPDGAVFDDFFESLGKKAEHLTVNEQNGKPISATTSPEGQITSVETPTSDDEPKIVDEIESLCMNCHENVHSTAFCVKI
jgi:zinc finger protein